MSLHLASAPPEGDNRPRSGPQRYVPFSEHLGLKVERAESRSEEHTSELQSL